MFKSIKNAMNKLAIKAVIARNNAQNAVLETMSNDDGMEVVQVLILVILAITLGAVLLGNLNTQFNTQLTKVGSEMDKLFPTA